MAIFGGSGERGKTGDHGQMGDPGQRGEVGSSGEQGTTGERGPAGERGPVGSRMSKAQLLAYAAIVLAGLYGFYSSEQADRESARQRAEICEREIQTREAVRKVYADIEALGRTLIDGSEPDDAVQIRALEQFIQARLEEYPPIKPGCLSEER